MSHIIKQSSSKLEKSVKHLLRLWQQKVHHHRPVLAPLVLHLGGLHIPAHQTGGCSCENSVIIFDYFHFLSYVRQYILMNFVHAC